jgi:hypothetical protein
VVQLQYHGVWVTSADPADNAEEITDGMPELLDRLNGVR